MLFDFLGALLWILVFTGLGYLFSNQLEQMTARVSRLGGLLAVILAAALGVFIAWKYLQRRRVMNELRIARITPEELRRKIESGERITVIDLRHGVEVESEPDGIPGALHLPAEELELRHGEIPRDGEVVLYCT